MFLKDAIMFQINTWMVGAKVGAKNLLPLLLPQKNNMLSTSDNKPIIDNRCERSVNFDMRLNRLFYSEIC